MESVSPYTTCSRRAQASFAGAHVMGTRTVARHSGLLFTMLMARSSVARPLLTIASASSTSGMRPEKLAAV